MVSLYHWGASKAPLYIFVQSPQLCPTLCDPMDCSQASLSFTMSWSLLKLMCIKSVMLSNHLILCYPVLLLPSIFPSIRVFFFFPMSCLFTLGDQSIGASASASVLPVNIQGWFSLALTGLLSLLSKGLSRVFSSITVWKHQFFGTQPSLWFNSLWASYMTPGKTIALTIWAFVGKVMSLFFNLLSRFVHCRTL